MSRYMPFVLRAHQCHRLRDYVVDARPSASHICQEVAGSDAESRVSVVSGGFVTLPDATRYQGDSVSDVPQYRNSEVHPWQSREFRRQRRKAGLGAPRRPLSHALLSAIVGAFFAFECKRPGSELRAACCAIAVFSQARTDCSELLELMTPVVQRRGLPVTPNVPLFMNRPASRDLGQLI
jgi:hypothetical protein